MSPKLGPTSSFLTYVLVGLATSGVYFSGVFLLSSDVSESDPILIVVPYTVAVAFNFLANFTLTFDLSKSRLAPHLVKYVIFSGFLLLIQLGLFTFLRDVVSLSIFYSAIILALSSGTLGFAGSKLWVFAAKR